MLKIEFDPVGVVPPTNDPENLILARQQLVEQAAQLLVQGAEIFESARGFCPGAVTQKQVLARMGSMPRLVTTPDGKAHYELSPMPEQPGEFVLPAIILPARKFKNHDTGAEIERRAALTMSAGYDYEVQSGVRDGLPSPMPLPDRITFDSTLPIALVHDRYEDPFESRSIELRTMQTISGDNVSVYADRWSAVGYPDYQAFPQRAYKDETQDWGAFLAYPSESLTQDMVDSQRLSAAWFIWQLSVVEKALGDPGLNSRGWPLQQ